MTIPDTFTPPLIYRLFFLYIEPLSALLGAYYAAYQPATYLALLSSAATSPAPDTPTLTSLYQLANLYLLFALNEHLVLSRSSSPKTWRTLLIGLLIADFGHLASMVPVALQEGKGVGDVFLRCWTWNAMEWGSVGFVYVGASMRISFLLGTSGWWKRGRSAAGKSRKEE